MLLQDIFEVRNGRIITKDNFVEQEHPRDPDGKFTEGSGGKKEVEENFKSDIKNGIEWLRDKDYTTEESVKFIQRAFESIPEKERKKSSLKKIEIYENPEDISRRLEEVGINPDLGEGGVVRGAYDFKNHIAYVSLYNSEEGGNSSKNFLHEFAHSILGPNENNIEGWIKAHGSTKKPAPTELKYEDLDENAKKKYDRITSLKKKFPSIWKENEPRINQDERAACLALIMKTGIRPGSDRDMKAKVKAYGATTLEGKHVVEENGNVTLKYVGKKGVSLNIPVTDKNIAKMLLDRKQKAGDDGRIFQVNEEKLSDYSHSLDGKEFKTKDFRTHIGTTTAEELIKSEPPPKDFKEYKKKVMAIAKGVAVKLGNGAVVCLQAYIDPRVFSNWRKGVEQ